MSKLSDGLISLNKNERIQLEKGFAYEDEPVEYSGSFFRRELGSVTLEENGIISKISGNVSRSLGVAVGYLFSDLFTDASVFQMKKAQLNRVGKTEVRIKDAQGTAFWARLTSKDGALLIEDIDIEKNFEIDTEDLIEEQERELSAFDFAPAYQ